MPKTKHQFTLTIDLGNASMRTGHDIAHALAKVATLIEERVDGNIAAGSIMDANGNKVGRWALDLPSKSDE
jgi:hypothetical protein